MNEKELIKEWYENRNITKLVAYFFNSEKERKDWILPTEGQKRIIEDILYSKKIRKLIPAHTRYGKSYWLSVGVALKILFSKNRKVYIIAPTDDKTKVIRDYIVQAIMSCPLLRETLDIDVDKDEKLKKEVSKKRMTFKNGCLLQTFSAEGDGKRLMSWGLGSNGGDLIVDELAEIKRDVVYTMILRMLGDNPEKSTFTALYNSWSKDSAAYEMEISGNYIVQHIDYKQGIAEERITEDFLHSQRQTLTKTQFQILYEARFPDETNDSLFSHDNLTRAREEIDYNENCEYLLGCDIAAFGNDLTVLTVVKHYLESDVYRIEKIQDFRKQDTMTTVGRIITLINEYRPSKVNIDSIGLGQGVYDRLKEQDFDINDVKVGRASNTNPQLYLNQKSEMYDNLRKLFENNKIFNLSNQHLFRELSIITQEYNSAGKMKIIDPEKSPDYADSLALSLFESNISYEVDVLDDFSF